LASIGPHQPVVPYETYSHYGLGQWKPTLIYSSSVRRSVRRVPHVRKQCHHIWYALKGRMGGGCRRSRTEGFNSWVNYGSMVSAVATYLLFLANPIYIVHRKEVHDVSAEVPCGSRGGAVQGGSWEAGSASLPVCRPRLTPVRPAHNDDMCL
jgi:hypothetical protein